MKFDLKATLMQYRRVLQIARKPNKDEFTGAGKICAIGILLIGFIGFAIYLALKITGI
jgi:protein translocase SEC61 complex gamma subunit